jgi:hypothetical protein
MRILDAHRHHARVVLVLHLRQPIAVIPRVDCGLVIRWADLPLPAYAIPFIVVLVSVGVIRQQPVIGRDGVSTRQSN